ncbi:hypothetical protein [[Mycoplasma] testudinis]|uniref:hypothetical protein n=1 Tax=[Mycoplasma] testudinis TaxID=33924 RepID=UPI000486BAAC|nr:hypothetical protein [[Mycoplasma] testudinis]
MNRKYKKLLYLWIRLDEAFKIYEVPTELVYSWKDEMAALIKKLISKSEGSSDLEAKLRKKAFKEFVLSPLDSEKYGVLFRLLKKSQVLTDIIHDKEITELTNYIASTFQESFQ